MIPCCVEGPAPTVPKLRYALEELLRGFGKKPVWTRAVNARIYAGPRPETAAPDALRFRVGAESERALEAPGLPQTVGWLHHRGDRLPLPVGPKGRPSSDPSHIMDADVLGSTFWWLSGAQERSASGAEMRFPFSASLQAQLDCALVPVVDLYREWLGEALRGRGEKVRLRQWNGRDWALALTHDVDAVATNRLRSLIGDTLRGHPIRGFQRLFGPDWRWQSLLDLRALALSHGVGATYFFKGGATAKQDVPYSLDGSDVSAFLREAGGAGFEIGLHPSYGAAAHSSHLLTERARLAQAIGDVPTLVRMHYLRWSEPDTPAMLSAAGFRADSTLGFSKSVGFRRGTCHPFRLYDAASDEPSDLWEVPLVVMDTTLFQHRKLTIEQAENRAMEALHAVKRVGGCAVVLWHNDMGEGKAWSARLGVLDRLLDFAQKEGGEVGALGPLLLDRGIDVSEPARGADVE